MKVSILRVLAYSLAFMLLFSGCRLRELYRATITPTFTPTPTPTFIPSPTLTETSTVTPVPTATFTPTITPISTIMDSPSSISYPLATCFDNQPYLGTWVTKQKEMLLEAFVCPDHTLIAVFHNQEFSDPIIIDQKRLDKKEDDVWWKVYIDVDSDKKTGLLGESNTTAGADYFLELTDYLSLLHYDPLLNGDEIDMASFHDSFEVIVWDCIRDKKCTYDPIYDSLFNPNFYADSIEKLIILKVSIPEINIDSKIMFARKDNNSNLTYQTDWVTSTIAP